MFTVNTKIGGNDSNLTNMFLKFSCEERYIYLHGWLIVMVFVQINIVNTPYIDPMGMRSESNYCTHKN